MRSPELWLWGVTDDGVGQAGLDVPWNHAGAGPGYQYRQCLHHHGMMVLGCLSGVMGEHTCPMLCACLIRARVSRLVVHFLDKLSAAVVRCYMNEGPCRHGAVLRCYSCSRSSWVILCLGGRPTVGQQGHCSAVAAHHCSTRICLLWLLGCMTHSCSSGAAKAALVWGKAAACRLCVCVCV